MFGRTAKIDKVAALEKAGWKVRVPPVDRLPAAAAAKLASIQDAVRDAFAVANSAGEVASKAHAEVRAASRDFEKLKRDGNATPAQYADAELLLKKVTAARERPEARHQKSIAARDAIAGLHQRIEKWIDAIPNGTVFKEVDAPKPKLVKGESLEEAIARCRRTVLEMRAKALDVRAAPVLAEEAKAVLKQYVSFLEGVGEPDLQHLLDAGRRRIDWPSRLDEVGPVFGLGQFQPPVALPAVAFSAWLDPDRLYARLCKQIDEEADDSIAISASDRLKMSMAIAAESLSAAREEEALITQAWAAGSEIARRANADPRAILNLSSDLPPPEDS